MNCKIILKVIYTVILGFGDRTYPSFFHMANMADRVWPLGPRNQGKGEKEKVGYKLPPETAGGLHAPDLGWMRRCVPETGEPEVRGLTEAAGHTSKSAWTQLVCCGLPRGTEEGLGLQSGLI